ncbi:STAS domain-containing protein [Ilumatobacter sp.]|uniref:STAS domain-containing protein n=1 Tax=Ilumatobacter sp. TaxID=1967498 RepID=UPI003C5A5127
MSNRPGRLDLEISVRGDLDVPEAEIRVIGEFDRVQIARFDRAGEALSQELVRLTVDLTRTTIIDSAALGSLIRLRHSLDRIGCQLRVVVSEPFQVMVMKVGGLYDFLGVVEE